MVDIMPIFEALLALLAALVTAYLIPWLKQKQCRERQQNLAFWLKAAVEAAEEYFIGHGRGAEKAAYVRQFLAKRGWRLDEQEAAVLINSTVWDLINRYALADDDVEEG